MRSQFRLGWLLCGIVAVGLFASAIARADEREVHYEDLPHNVQRALDHERADHKISQLWQIHTRDHNFYRAIVEFGDGEHVIRVGDDGRVLTVDTLGPDERAWEDNWHHEHEAHDGTVIEDRDIPRAVQRAIDHELGHGHVREVRQFMVEDLPVYQVVVEGRGEPRVLEILPDGTFYGEGEDIRHGLHVVSIDDLPREARDSIHHEAGHVRVEKVFATTRHGDKVFTAIAWEGHGDRRFITVTEHGDVIHEADTH